MAFTEGDLQYPDKNAMAQLQESAKELGIDPQLLIGDGPLPEEADRSRERKLLTGFFDAFIENLPTKTSSGFETHGNAASLEEVEANGKWAVEIRRREGEEYRLDIYPVGGKVDHAMIQVRPAYQFASADSRSLSFDLHGSFLGTDIAQRHDLRKAIALYTEVKGALAQPFSLPSSHLRR